MSRRRSNRPAIVVLGSRQFLRNIRRYLRGRSEKIINLQTLEIRASSPKKLLSSVIKLRQKDWLLFMSKNAVKYFFMANPKSVNLIPRLAAVGEETAKAVKKYFRKVDFVPREFNAENLAMNLPDIRQRRVCVIGAKKGKNIVPILKKMGARAEKISIYDSRAINKINKKIIETFNIHDIKAVLFPSPLSLRSFVSQMGDDEGLKVLKSLLTVAIGKSTSLALKKAGATRVVIAKPNTALGMATMLKNKLK